MQSNEEKMYLLTGGTSTKLTSRATGSARRRPTFAAAVRPIGGVLVRDVPIDQSTHTIVATAISTSGVRLMTSSRVEKSP
eukprot:3152231-Prymnesium_polylepis.1